MKHTFKIEMEVELLVPDAPDGTPEYLQNGLINGFAEYIAGMIEHQSELIAESKMGEVVTFSYELPLPGGSMVP